jgi:adenylate cyclase
MATAKPSRSLLPYLLGLLVTIAMVAGVQLWAPQALNGVERQVGDLTWRLGASADRSERRVVVVDIDESSLSKVGPWPWPRSTLAELSGKLKQAGAVSQVFDMVFPEPREGDPEFAETLASGSITAGQIFSLDEHVTPRVGQVGGALQSGACPPFVPQSHGYIANSPSLVGNRLSIGHLTPRVEHDGVIRMVPALICQDGRSYPALALTAIWRLAQSGANDSSAVSTPDWQVAPNSGVGALRGMFAPHAVLYSPSLPGVTVPVDDNGNIRVPYRIGRTSFASISASEVLAGHADSAILNGSVALIGATAFGMGDSKSTPQAAVASGLEVQTQLLVGLLDGRLPYTPAGAIVIGWVVGLTGLSLIFFLALRSSSAGVKRLPIAGALIALVFPVGSMLLLWNQDVWVHWAVPSLLAIVGSTVLSTVEHGLTRAQRERLSAHLGAYLPEPVARRLMRTDPSGNIQVEQRPVSVLVADIRNFSAFVSHRPPAETTSLLHAFCCIAVDVVEAHGGVVENVVGDSVLAVWNAYSDCADHAQQSVSAAKELVRATRALLEPPRPVQDSDAVQPLALGVGVETGVALVGSFGPIRRRAHAALGEPVSVAARLQHMTQDLSLPMLLGPKIAQELNPGDTEFVGEFLLEGLSKHYSVYSPVDWTSLLSSEMTWARPTEVSLDSEAPFFPDHALNSDRSLARPFGKTLVISPDV